MEIRFAEQADKLMIAFIGDLDNAAAPEAEIALEKVYDRNDCDIMIDCSHLNYISSKGLRILLTLYKHQRANGKSALISNMNKNVREVLDIGGFLTLYKEIV